MSVYFEFEVSLLHAQPRIWRRFLLRRAGTFQDLHKAIQDACGWQGYHLFEFRMGGRMGRALAGMPDEEEQMDGPVPDAKRVKLVSYFGDPANRGWCFYLYDFGDGWEHEVQLLREVSLGEPFRKRLLGGERSFPPEDCGSYPGYERCVRVVRGEESGIDELDGVDLKRWMGDWDPEFFDLKSVKRTFDR